MQQAVQAAHGRLIALLPMEDATCEWLLQHGASLPGNVHWLLPTESSFAVARDKARTFEIAQQLGIPCPRTFAPASVEELARLIAAHPAENFVIKPRTGSGSSGIVYGAAIRDTPLDEHWSAHGPLLLQERIPADGEARGVSMLFDHDSQPRASFAHRRLRQYPVSGGPSTQRDSVPLDELHDFSQRLLSALGWRGVAMVEWKIHPVTRRPLLLEINPRFWGSLALAVRAGVDFPTLYADAALGRPLPATLPAYRSGVVCRWLLPGDILRYLSEASGQRESLGRFLRGTLKDSEEFDGNDWRGSLACGLCPALLALNPKYWRYLRRGHQTRP
ncbi:MAG: ATP-grasp domain-containing protein [Bryobacterales bacterium]|nr:ATP-grasp domain-containing protein [Bryobacterales bacterium]